MSLAGKVLQTVDTMNVKLINKKSGAVTARGNTTKANFSNKVDKIEINSGIGMQKQCTLKTKKTTEITFTITAFDLEVMALQNGITLDKISTGTYFWDTEVAVATAAATVTGATRILAVLDSDMNPMQIVTTTPASNTEVKVAGTALTFNAGYTGTKVYVTYEAPATAGKDNLTIKFNSKTFAQAFEFVGNTVAYDQDTEAICADVVIDYYACELNDDFEWNFEGGKNLESNVTLSVITPKKLPDGTINKDGDTGKLVVTER